ncbi:hypothetical protein ZWY2020_031432 [Hordeum vulgare]|nr:hypothetical protein ZWY2020_031432 [Hordeum vulgare]
MDDRIMPNCVVVELRVIIRRNIDLLLVFVLVLICENPETTAKTRRISRKINAYLNILVIPLWHTPWTRYYGTHRSQGSPGPWGTHVPAGIYLPRYRHAPGDVKETEGSSDPATRSPDRLNPRESWSFTPPSDSQSAPSNASRIAPPIASGGIRNASKRRSVEFAVDSSSSGSICIFLSLLVIISPRELLSHVLYAGEG